jgi:nucleoid DNA-binding protein
MTKAEIIAEISSKTGIEKVDVQETVEAFFKVVKTSMVGGENVYVRGFGSFVVKKELKKQPVTFQKILPSLSLSILYQALNQLKLLLKK